MLSTIDDDRVAVLRVEGGSKDSGRDIVDFDLLADNEACMLAVQVKSMQPGGTMRAGDAFGILCKLVTQQEAERYELVTNAAPGPRARQLAQALEAGHDPDELRNALALLLDNAPARLAELDRLDGEALRRLARARIQFDLRQSEEIRADLNGRLRGFRNRHREGLGERSAGLLIGYLVGEVLRRAADGEAARWSRAEFRDELLIPSADLARLAQSRDWGHIIGHMQTVPDIGRPAVEAAVSAALVRSGDRVVRQLALVGPSGIGKSSLAAAYIADQADQYDLILWLDAETEASLVASIHHALATVSGAALPPNAVDNPAHLRNLLSVQLSSLPGRWAIVFDNTSDPVLPAQWLPAAGRGDVILTSLNGAANYGQAAVIEVGTMTESEGMQLLRSRLPASWDNAPVAALRSLLDVAAGWPLAIELITGYLTTCEIGPEGIDDFVVAIRRRAIDDQGALPPDYPRTLTAAIRMCLEPLIDRWRRAVTDPAAAMPIAFLTAAAYLGSRRIPVQLIGASLMLDHEQATAAAPERGATYIDPPAFELREAIRAVRRYSLLGSDEPIPPEHDRTSDDYVQALQVNSIVQEIVRAHHEYLPNRHAILMLLAAHTNLWLAAAAHFGQWQRVRLLLAHARTLFNHVATAQVVESSTMLLAINVALMQRASGDFETAEDLWRNLVDIYTTDPAPDQENLYVQVLAHLVCLRLERPDRSKTTDQELKAWLERILQFAQAHAVTAPEVAAQVIEPVIGSLHTNAADASIDATAAIGPLRHVFDDLASRLPQTPLTRRAQQLRELETTFADEDFDNEAGIRLCREILASGEAGGLNELSARRLLIELLLRQLDWKAASDEFQRFKVTAETVPLNIGAVNSLVHNAGFRCAMHACLGIEYEHDDAVAMLHKLVAWPLAPILAQQASVQDQHRFRLLQAVDRLLGGDLDTAEQLMLGVELDDFAESDNVSTPGSGWHSLWHHARLELYRRAWDDRHRLDGSRAGKGSPIP